MSLTLTLERGGGEVSGSGTQIELEGTGEGYSLESVTMNGDTEQATIPGDQLLKKDGMATPISDTEYWNVSSSVTQTPLDDGWATFTKSSTQFGNLFVRAAGYDCQPSTTYTIIIETKNSTYSGGSITFVQSNNNTDPVETFTIIAGCSGSSETSVSAPLRDIPQYNVYKMTTKSTIGDYGIRQFINANNQAKSIDLRVTVLLGDHSSDWQNYAGENWQPFVGAIASPNPDYPQEVQTVTGRQVVTISDGGSESQTYTIDLGDIELCKIGDYQDYIYKSGEDWYLHKETNKLNLQDYSTLSWWKSGSAIKINWDYLAIPAAVVPSSMNIAGETYCDHFMNGPAQEVWNGTRLVGYGLGPDGFYFNNNYSTTNDFKTYIKNTPVYVYYAIATPTDTQVTNAALVAQLDALSSAQTYDGTTYITVSSENLKGSLDVTSEAPIYKTYTEVEIGSPFTIADVEGKSSNTTLDGNVYVDWAYNKKQYSFDLFNLTPQDYADIRAFYDYQFNNSAFPTITVPELNIEKLPVYMEISSRNIINQCLLTDKLTIKFRETVQP